MRRVIIRETTSAGVRLRKLAEQIGLQTKPGRSITRIVEGFLIRSVSGDERTIVQVVELPLYIAGVFGGMQTGHSEHRLFTQVALIGRTGMQSALLETEIRLNNDPATQGERPYLAELSDNYAPYAPVGSGYVQIGELPPWEQFRDAIQPWSGVPTICPSAILVPATALIEESSVDDPRLSLMLTRTNGRMKRTPMLEANAPLVPSEDGGFPGHPFCLNERASKIETLAVIEFGPQNFDLNESPWPSGPAERLYMPGACLEWGARKGLASCTSGDRYSSFTNMHFLAYTLTESQEAGTQEPVAGAAAWRVALNNDSLSSEDASNIAGMDIPSVADSNYQYPWHRDTTVGGLKHERSILLLNSFLFLTPSTVGQFMVWGKGIGYELSDEQPIQAMGLINLDTVRQGGPMFARGSKSNGDGTYSYINTPCAEAPFRRKMTIAFRVDSGGVTVTRVLHAYDYERYNNLGNLVSARYCIYNGVNALDGTPRIITTKQVFRYRVAPAEADSGPFPGRPERKEVDPHSYWIRLADLSHFLVDENGNETSLNLGPYYVAQFSAETTAPGGGTSASGDGPTDARRDFGGFHTGGLHTDSEYAYLRSEPFCQYAPGIIAAVVCPASDYLSALHSLHIALFNVSTGARIAISPALTQFATRVKMALTCIEQGTVDEHGSLTGHGRLLLSFSSRDTSESRVDGFFVVTHLKYISWLAREPSNTWGVYVGSDLLPAEIGVTTGLKILGPTPIDQ